MYYEDSLPPEPGRPPEVPAKFWDEAKGAIRTDALLQAYLELEKRMHRQDGDCCPASAEDYAIDTRHPLLSSDAQVNARLHGAGFTQSQAQLVYDLAHDHVMPLLEEMDSDTHLRRLKDHFGGDSRWAEVARQLSAWGRQNLPPDVFDALSKSPEGIIAMERMMASGEPAMGRAAAPRDEALGEDELKRMLQDPRYWKKKDPAFIAKVSAGFRRLHGE